VVDAASFLELEDAADEPWFIEPKDKDPASEIERQSLFLSRLKILAPAVDALAIPNAGKSTDWQRIQRWREGARRGALDLILTWQPARIDDRGVFFAEFKDGDGMPTKDQRERLNRYYRMGHKCGVYRNPERAIRARIHFARDQANARSGRADSPESASHLRPCRGHRV
jgi:hypothetical protein